MFRSQLYAGTVYHRRVRPKVHQLSYRVFSLMLDLDELPDLHRQLRGFSWNSFNVLSVYDKDFGVNASCGLRRGVELALVEAGVTEAPDKITLSCFPRILGYAFNPLSVYYCMRENGDVYAVIHEVHNTFGERHVYVLPVKNTSTVPEQGDAAVGWIQQETDKELFVSPFAHMDMHYHFRLNVPEQRQVIAIRLHDDNGLVLTASYCARRAHLSSKALFKQVFSMPFMCLKIMAGIHWEALRLWLKRVPWFSHVPKNSARSSMTKS